jgi:hypothetical protein
MLELRAIRDSKCQNRIIFQVNERNFFPNHQPWQSSRIQSALSNRTGARLSMSNLDVSLTCHGINKRVIFSTRSGPKSCWQRALYHQQYEEVCPKTTLLPTMWRSLSIQWLDNIALYHLETWWRTIMLVFFSLSHAATLDFGSCERKLCM